MTIRSRMVSIGAVLGVMLAIHPGLRAGGAPKRHTVTMEATGFQPAALTVKAGDTVVWVNKDPFPHTATSAVKKFDSGQIAPEKSWTFKVPATMKGEIPYGCTLHPTMKATLKVE